MRGNLRVFVLVLLGVFLISGCGEAKKDFAYLDLLTDKEGTYSLLVVIDQPEGKMEEPNSSKQQYRVVKRNSD